MPTQFPIRIVLACVAFFMLTTCRSTSAADIIVRKSSTQRLAGSITAAGRDEITIKPTTGDPVKVPVGDVASIEFDDWPAGLKIAVSDENGGRLERALEAYQKIKTDYKGSNDIVKRDIEYLIARAVGKMALADPGRVAEAVAALENVQKSASDHFRYYESVLLLGRLHLNANDFEKAQKAYEQVGRSQSKDMKLLSKLSVGRVLLAQGKFDEATAAFDEAISSADQASPAENARRFEAMTAKARVLLAQNRAADAVTALEEVIDKAPADDSSLQAEAYLLYGHALRTTQRNKEAVLAFLHVDILFSRETDYHAESLYQLGRLWKTVQLPERGAEAIAKLQGTYPNSDWTKKAVAGE